MHFQYPAYLRHTMLAYWYASSIGAASLSMPHRPFGPPAPPPRLVTMRIEVNEEALEVTIFLWVHLATDGSSSDQSETETTSTSESELEEGEIVDS